MAEDPNLNLENRNLLIPAGAISRRCFAPAAAAVLSGCRNSGKRSRAGVFVARAASYDADLADLIARGLKACRIDPRGKRVLLKPNLVEFDRSAPINTHPAVVAAAYDVFRRMGAASVKIGEGPGHRRDTLFLAEEAGYREALPGFDDLFVDLNRDEVSVVSHSADFGKLFLPNTALQADLIVSLAKMKTHHWAGATLSMKNLFGLVPGAVYGWPKNILHQAGIPRSIVELNRIFRNTCAIVDGIVGMEGNGPIHGNAKSAGVLVIGADLVAVDATCCRIMGIDPFKLRYLEMARDLGQLDGEAIEQLGEGIVPKPFALIEEFRHARLA